MVTNCGFMTKRWYDTYCVGLNPSITSVHIPYFHSLMCEWAYNIALPFFWVVVIEAQNKQHLLKSILDVGNIEPSLKGKWDISQRELNFLFDDRTQNTIGCIFADAVRIPSETANTDYSGGHPTGGFIGGPIMNGRSNFEGLEIGFRETNLSFADFLIRPWSIVGSYKGLIADDGGIQSNSGASYWGGSIKANIHLYQLAKGGDGRNKCEESVIRKQFHFYDAVPIFINDDDLTSEGSGGPNKRQTRFIYNYYTVGKGNAAR